MAIVQVLSLTGYNGFSSDPLGFQSVDGDIASFTPDLVSLFSPTTGTFNIIGTGIGGNVNGDPLALTGTVTGITSFDVGGNGILSVTGTAVPFSQVMLQTDFDTDPNAGQDLARTFFAGADNFTGSNGGNDIILTFDGNDFVAGLAGNDLIYGNRNDDQLFGGLDNDTIFGGQQNDFLAGEQGNDVLYGNFDSDVLLGGDGDDTIFAGQGDDNVNAEAGNDFLAGNRGNDTLAGGSGADEFRFNFALGQGANVISDFTAGEDRITVVNTAIGGVAAAFDAGANATLIRSDVAFDQGQFLRQPDGSVLFESAGTFQNTVVIVGGDFTGLIGDSILFT